MDLKTKLRVLVAVGALQGCADHTAPVAESEFITQGDEVKLEIYDKAGEIVARARTLRLDDNDERIVYAQDARVEIGHEKAIQVHASEVQIDLRKERLVFTGRVRARFHDHLAAD